MAASPTTAISIDGRVPVGILPRDGCCVPSISNITLCALICNFVHQLPIGPLWDRPKMEAFTWANQGGCDTGECPPPQLCGSIVAHAIFTANGLWSTIMDGLAVAIRESDPFTAYDTIDDWLARLGWQNCFASACRSPALGPQTPLEVMGDCCLVNAEPDYGAPLTLAVKVGTVHALARLGMGIVPNLDAINFVIEPLGAKLIPVGPTSTPAPDIGQCPPPTDPHCGTSSNPSASGVVDPCCPRTDHPVFRIDAIASTLPVPYRAVVDVPDANNPDATIPAFYKTQRTDAPGLPPKIWPGLLAAECIVRSILSPMRPYEIQRYF
jgi:hypothetical protein